MSPTFRAIVLSASSVVMAGLGPNFSALQWPTGTYLGCDQTSTDIFHVFSSSQRIASADTRGRPLSMQTVIINRNTKIDTIDMSIQWYPDFPVEKWWQTRQAFSFPAQILYRTVNSAGIVELDTLSSVWNPVQRTLVYTTTNADYPSKCGWTDSIAFDESLRCIEQATCEGSTQTLNRRFDRFYYDGANRTPISIATRWDSAKSGTDSIWYEGPAEAPSRENLLQIRPNPYSTIKLPTRRLQKTDFTYGPDGKLQGMKTATTQDTALVGLSDTWITWGSTGTWDKLEGFEVEIGTTRDSLWWSATCSDIPSALRVHKKTPETRSSRLVRGNSGWILLTDHTPIGPVEWIGADGMRSTVQVSSRSQGLQLHWSDNSRPGWIRFRTSSGAELIPTSGLVR